jgi:hypothetical protein
MGAGSAGRPPPARSQPPASHALAPRRPGRSQTGASRRRGCGRRSRRPALGALPEPWGSRSAPRPPAARAGPRRRGTRGARRRWPPRRPPVAQGRGSRRTARGPWRLPSSRGRYRGDRRGLRNLPAAARQDGQYCPRQCLAEGGPPRPGAQHALHTRPQPRESLGGRRCLGPRAPQLPDGVADHPRLQKPPELGLHPARRRHGPQPQPPRHPRVPLRPLRTHARGDRLSH